MASVKKQKRNRSKTYIKAWRNLRELSQEKVAEKIGISRENYGRIESGKVPYNQDYLELCAETLNCTPADLLGCDPKMQNLVEQLHALVVRAHHSDQKRVLDIAKTLIENKG